MQENDINEKLLYTGTLLSAHCGDPNGEGNQKRGIYVCVTDSLCCIAKANTIL